ncbi:ABC transporter substrate-binding protein [Paenibacillus paeoniae]|uniref:Fe3+-hydroxamate ABC transporter substrate-binding protein n=1 Tax=Paenibacillus paeoniae TaxID=2292705 RepID=A0A371PGQ9_9BACL|nr:ABC transporter substrate-binding protein [Paenibacillus paeoniae]REK75122.1 Fe3+-hydroxamate ABC transporter substrate-binding protein [Paenibacillus paeoniae]
MRFHFFRIAVLIMSVTLVLAACGNTGNTQGNGNQPGNETKQREEAATTRKWTDGSGREVEIPVNPQRVITTQYLPEMLALGVKPIAAPRHLLTNFASVRDKIDGIEDLGAVNELNVEKALALNPDLILTMEDDQELIDKLSKIAPTVVVTWNGKDAFDHLKDTADVLGLSDQAEQWIADYKKKVAETKEKLAPSVSSDETFGTVVIGGYKEAQLRVYADQNVGYTFFHALGFPMLDSVKSEWEKEKRPLGMDISMELLPEYASADRLFVVKFDNDPGFLDQVLESSLWKNLPAVKNNRVYVLESALWFPLDALSLDQQLDDVVKLLTQE